MYFGPERRRIPPLLGTAQWTVTALTHVAVVGAFVTGTVIVTGGRERFSGPSLTVANHAPGAPPSWGFALLAFAFLSFYGWHTTRPCLVRVGLWLIGSWCAALAVAFAIAAARYDNAQLVGPVTYTIAAVAYWVLSHAYKANRGNTRAREST